MERHDDEKRSGQQGGERQADGDPENPTTTPDPGGSGQSGAAGKPQPEQDERQGGYGGSTGGQDPNRADGDGA